MIIPQNCPFCKSDLKGDLIKDEERALVYDDKSFWSRVKVIVEDKKPAAWMCPDCGGEWAIGWLSKPLPPEQNRHITD